MQVSKPKLKFNVQRINTKAALVFATMIGLNLSMTGCVSNKPPMIIAPMIDFTKTDCKPDYPRAALQNGQTGVVVLLLVVERDGSISQADIVKSTGFPILDNVVKDRLLAGQCKGKPGTVDGQPQKTIMKIQYVWKLN